MLSCSIIYNPLTATGDFLCIVTHQMKMAGLIELLFLLIVCNCKIKFSAEYKDVLVYRDHIK